MQESMRAPCRPPTRADVERPGVEPPAVHQPASGGPWCEGPGLPRGEDARVDTATEQALLFGAAQTAMLFEGLAGFLFVVKDRAGRYVSFNASLLQRLGLPQDASLHGRTVTELWPDALSSRYMAQDEWVLSRRSPLLYQLDPILLPGGSAGWCVTHKYPLCSAGGQMHGILCLSKDVPGLRRDADDAALVEAVDAMTKTCERRHSVAQLAGMAGLSQARFSALVRRVFGMSPQEFIVRHRVRAACALLRQDGESLMDVALGCGFYDQAQFSRQFRRVVGMAPSAYRRQWTTQASGAMPWPWEPWVH
ncbi:AraC family transcriptional regulator [Mitsuaria sp. WAJ17]|uniref:AraC family transcriptional regulator n=1 Tax=Mitsuaria sp. WAJ17 TaxID=2761452 RepID=UPI0015FFCB58|nr:AraC family transcriptional regulator [Mitsuaria sp. WAJ17]MBB2485931.1 AraC family transcriptional regulator [Mitsuaria sp. WAJ17]